MGAETAFVWRGLFPSEDLARKSLSINWKEGKGEGRKHLWSRVEGAESKADTRTHTAEARE